MAEFDDIAAAMRALARKRVLIGIPGEGEPRADGTFGNVSRGYVFEFGSPAINMPARPHLVPGVEDAMPEIVRRLEAAAKAALTGGDPDMFLAQAGQAGENAVKARIDSHISPDIKPESLLNRVTGRTARVRRARAAGASLIEQARGEAASATPLVDTGAYRQSIRWVIRET
jgi:hypothetical protein